MAKDLITVTIGADVDASADQINDDLIRIAGKLKPLKVKFNIDDLESDVSKKKLELTATIKPQIDTSAINEELKKKTTKDTAVDVKAKVDTTNVAKDVKKAAIATKPEVEVKTKVDTSNVEAQVKKATANTTAEMEVDVDDTDLNKFETKLNNLEKKLNDFKTLINKNPEFAEQYSAEIEKVEGAVERLRSEMTLSSFDTSPAREEVDLLSSELGKCKSEIELVKSESEITIKVDDSRVAEVTSELNKLASAMPKGEAATSIEVTADPEPIYTLTDAYNQLAISKRKANEAAASSETISASSTLYDAYTFSDTASNNTNVKIATGQITEAENKLQELKTSEAEVEANELVVKVDDTQVHTAEAEMKNFIATTKEFVSTTSASTNMYEAGLSAAGKLYSTTTDPIKQATELANVSSSLNDVEGKLNKFKTALTESSAAESQFSERMSTIKTSLNGIRTGLNDGTMGFDEAKDRVKMLSAQIKEMSSELSLVPKNTPITEVGTSAEKSATQVKGLSTIFTDLYGKISSFQSHISTFMSLYYAVQMVVSMFEQLASVIEEVDSQMAQLEIVTGANDSQLNNYASTIADVADKTAGSIADLVESTTTYARLGYNLDQSTTLSELTAELQNVGDIDVDTAQSAITAIVKAYSVGADDLENVMDKLVAVGNNFPISVSELAEGMNNAGSMLSSSGNSLDESFALLTSANTTVQNISKSSTGLRTIAARLRKMKTELDDLGEAYTEADYDAIVQALTEQNVSLTDENGELRSTYDVLEDIAEVWDSLTSMEQAGLAEKIAGTRQQNIFYSIIDNFKEAQNAMDTMASSDTVGTLAEKNEIYTDTVEAHLQRVKNAWTSFLDTEENENFIKDLAEIAVNIIQAMQDVVQFIDKLGGLKAILLALAPLWGNALGNKIISATASLMQKTAVSMSMAQAKVLGLVKGFNSLSASEEKAAVSAQKVVAAEAVAQANIGATSTSAAASVYAANSVKALSKHTTNNTIEKNNDATLYAYTASNLSTVEKSAISYTTAATSATKSTRILSSVFSKAKGVISGVASSFVTLSSAFMGVIGMGSMIAGFISNIVSGLAEGNKEVEDYSSEIGDTTSSIESVEEAYENYKSVINDTSSTSEEIVAARESMIESLGLESDEVEQLVAKWGSYSEAIEQAYAAQSRKNLSDSIQQYKGDLEAMSDSVQWWNSDNVPVLGSILNSLGLGQIEGLNWLTGPGAGNTMTQTLSADLGDNWEEVQKVLNQAGMDVQTTTDSIMLNWEALADEDNNWDANNLYEYMTTIDEAMQLLSENELDSSPLYTALSEQMGVFGETYSDITQAVDNTATELVDLSEQSNSDLLSKTEKILNNESATFEEKQDAIDDYREAILSSIKADSSFKSQTNAVQQSILEEASALIDSKNGFDQYAQAAETAAETVKSSFEQGMEAAQESADGLYSSITEVDNILNGKDSEGNAIHDYDEGLNSAVEYYEALKELADKGAVGSEKYKALSEWFVGENGDLNMDALSRYFSDADAGLSNFLVDVANGSEDLQKLITWDANTGTFWYDQLNTDDIAKSFGITEDALEALIEKVHYYSADWEDITGKEAASWLEADKAITKYGDSVLINTTRVKEYAESEGLSNKETKELINNLKDFYGEGAKTLSFEVTDKNSISDVTKNIKLLKESFDEAGTEASTQASIIANSIDGLNAEQIAIILNDDSLAGMKDKILDALPDDLEVEVELVLSDETFTNREEKIEQQVESLQSKIDSISFNSVGMDPLTLQVNANNAEQQIQDIINELNSLPTERAVDVYTQLDIPSDLQSQIYNALPPDLQVAIQANADSANGAIDETEGKVNNLDGATAVAYVEVDGAEYSNIKIQGVATHLENLNGTRATTYIDTITSTKNAAATGSPSVVGGPTLLGDEFSASGKPKPELVVHNGGAYLAGQNGPEVRDLSPGDQVYNYSQTKRLFGGSNKFPGSIPALAGGTVSAIALQTGLSTASVSDALEDVSSYTSDAESSAKAAAKDTKDLFDWIEIKLDKVSDTVSSISDKVSDTMASFSSRLKNATKEISVLRSGVKTTSSAASRYKAQANKAKTYTWYDDDDKKRSLTLTKSQIKRIQNGTIDISSYDENRIAAIKEYKEWYDKYLDALETEKEYQQQIREAYKDRFDIIKSKYDTKIESKESQRYKYEANEYTDTLGTKNKKLTKQNKLDTSEINTYNKEIKALKAARNAAKKNGVKGEDLADMNSEIASIREKISELGNDIKERIVEKFNNISDAYEEQLSLMDHMTTRYNNKQSILEANGYLNSTKYYKLAEEQTKESINKQRQELSKLKTALKQAVSSGAIKEGSDAWYEMKEQIESVTESIQDQKTELAEYESKIREVVSTAFSNKINLVSGINDEADFNISMLENEDMFNDEGDITDAGITTMGLRIQKMQTYSELVSEYAKRINDINAELAEDPFNQDLQDELSSTISAQREAALAAEDEKQALKDLAEEGVQKLLDSMKDLIDTYEDDLDSAKDLYDFQKKQKEQTENIAKLQKQITAYSGDTSEETRATVQQLKTQLEEAQEDLEDSQYERYISDSKKLLDNLYDDYEDTLNKRLDDIDSLITEMQTVVHSDMGIINTTIGSVASDTGVAVSAAMASIWNGSSVEEGVSKVVSDANEYSSKSIENSNGGDSSLNDDNVFKPTETSGEGTTENATANAGASINGLVKTNTDTKYYMNGEPIKSTAKTLTTSDGVGSDGIYFFDKNGNMVTKKVLKLTKADGVPKDGTYYFSKNGNAVKDKLVSLKKAQGVYKDGYYYFNTAGRMVSSTTKKLTKSDSNGVSYNGYYRFDEKGRLFERQNLKKQTVKKYATGGLVTSTGLAQLDGTTSKPEIVLSASDSKNFMALRDSLRDLASNNVLSGLSNNYKVPVGGSVGGINVGDTTVNIAIDHVEGYDDFVTQLQSDKKFEKLIQSMTIDRLSGKNSLSKNGYRW